MSAAGKLLLSALLRRQGEDVLRQAIFGDGRELRSAVRNCRRCAAAERCRALLASGAREGYAEFCPNAGFIEHAKTLVV